MEQELFFVVRQWTDQANESEENAATRYSGGKKLIKQLL